MGVNEREGVTGGHDYQIGQPAHGKRLLFACEEMG